MGKPVHLAKVSKEYGDSWAYCTQWSSRIVACTLFARAVTCKLCKRMKVYRAALETQKAGGKDG